MPLRVSAAVVLGVLIAGALVAYRQMSARSPAAPESRGAGTAGALTLIMTPGLSFDGQSPGRTVTAPSGTEARLTVINRDALQHDLWIVAADERAPYLEPVFAGAKTKLLASGEEATIRFVPSRSGVFKYVCTVPGHDDAMFGSFIVEPGP